MAISFHLDENMPHAVADGLRKRDIDVTTASDAGLIGASDEEHLAFARSTHRIIVTRDADYLRLNAVGLGHPGIVFWTQRRPIGLLISSLDMLAAQIAPTDLENQVRFL
jgi:predicted nuclease of predicted toxin-antitoxin system